VERIWYDDYSNLPVGEYPQDYSALGEYHWPELEGETGNWNATTVHHSWRGSPSWIVTTEGGNKVLELASIRQRALPMIITGADWDDFALTTKFRPISTRGEFGIVFRYETSRHYYALWYAYGRLQLIVRSDSWIRVLAEVDVDFNCDQYYDVRITVNGTDLEALAGGYRLQVDDSTYGRGRVGFAGTHPVRFGPLEVWMEAQAVQACRKRAEARLQKEEDKRSLYPQPQLWKVISTPGFGAGKSIRFGDLNGDGRKEILLAQNIRRIRGDNFSEISCLTAIDLDGNVLWQYGEPNPANALVSNDLPFQIHDLDQDGHQEVIFCKDFQIYVVDGQTGTLKYSAPTPKAPAHQGPKMPKDQYDRICGDSLYFCDLSGTGRDQDLLIKDRYNNIWAYTWDLKLRWHYQGNCGHYPMGCDIDHDGKDEILIGYTLLDHDGKVMWSLDIGDHADGVAVGKFTDSAEWQFIIAASDEGMYWVDRAGRILKHWDVGHSQTATIAQFKGVGFGIQVATVTFWGNPGIIIFFDAAGNLLSRKELIAPRGTALSPVNWDGSGKELLLISGHSAGGLIDDDFDWVAALPDDGHPHLCCEPVDLVGDARDEILVWDQNSIWIYTQDRPGPQQCYKPLRQPDYNMSNYRAQISLPNLQER
jgi:hypothetical protein